MLLVRGKEPSLGKLDLPGGFVDPGEGALDGLRRELREEIGWEPPPAKGPRGEAGVFTLFASFPNVYPYKNILYNTCDLFFTLDAPGLREEDLKLEAGEIRGIRFARPGNIDPQDLAFESTKRALRAFVEFWGN
jgi:ADP-ribose pyrophosphatase YjhB (NUDIX family)